MSINSNFYRHIYVYIIRVVMKHIKEETLKLFFRTG